MMPNLIIYEHSLIRVVDTIFAVAVANAAAVGAAVLVQIKESRAQFQITN